MIVNISSALVCSAMVIDDANDQSFSTKKTPFCCAMHRSVNFQCYSISSFHSVVTKKPFSSSSVAKKFKFLHNENFIFIYYSIIRTTHWIFYFILFLISDLADDISLKADLLLEICSTNCWSNTFYWFPELTP